MVLHGDQKWSSPGKRKTNSRLIVVDDTDSSSRIPNTLADVKNCHLHIGSLVTSIHNEPSQISLLGGRDLEKLSDMDPDSLTDIVADR